MNGKSNCRKFWWKKCNSNANPPKWIFNLPNAFFVVACTATRSKGSQISNQPEKHFTSHHFPFIIFFDAVKIQYFKSFSTSKHTLLNNNNSNNKTTSKRNRNESINSMKTINWYPNTHRNEEAKNSKVNKNYDRNVENCLCSKTHWNSLHAIFIVDWVFVRSFGLWICEWFHFFRFFRHRFMCISVAPYSNSYFILLFFRHCYGVFYLLLFSFVTNTFWPQTFGVFVETVHYLLANCYHQYQYQSVVQFLSSFGVCPFACSPSLLR